MDLRLFALSAALFQGLVLSLRCPPNDHAYCYEMLKREARCEQIDTDAYFCYPVWDSSDQKLTLYETQKQTLMAPQNYTDCFCDYCSVNFGSLGQCSTQTSGKQCHLIQATNGNTKVQYRTCATDQASSQINSALQSQGYNVTLNVKFVPIQSVYNSMPYSCLIQGFFYSTTYDVCYSQNYTLPGMIGLNDVQGPLDNSYRCQNITISSDPTQSQYISYSIPTEKGCVVELLITNITQAINFYYLGQESNLVNIYMMQMGQWTQISRGYDLLVSPSITANGGYTQSYLLVNVDPAGAKKLSFKIYQEPTPKPGNMGEIASVFSGIIALSLIYLAY